MSKRKRLEEQKEEELLEASNQKTTEEPAFISGTVIGEGMTLVGDFISKEPITIKGELKGRISSNATVTIEYGGSINGGADAQNIIVNGNANGKFIARNICHISNTGDFRGKLSTAKIDADENAYFDGELLLPAINRTLVKKITPSENSTPLQVGDTITDDELEVFENIID